jgi:hypothetical protein
LTLGLLSVAAGVAAATLGATAGGADGGTRDAARSALVAPDGSARAVPRGRLAQYWWSLAGFEEAVGAVRESRSDRVERLAAVAAVLARQAAHGSPSERSLNLSLLALTRLARQYLGAGGPGGGKSPAAALRAAVVLDAANDDAKANLELVLQTGRNSTKGSRPRDQGKGKKAGQASNPSTKTVPASGAGRNVEKTPVGY